MDFSFEKDLDTYLTQLRANSQPRWGQMGVVEMLEHLRQGVEMSMESTERALVIPEEKISSYQRFLQSEKPFMRHAPKPADYNKYAEKVEGEDIELAKIRLKEAVVKLHNFYKENPEFTAVHPNFGRLDVPLWLALHKKHFLHHFSQFGLLEFA